MATASDQLAPVVGPLWSHNCTFEELVVPFPVPETAEGLDTGVGWTRRWTARWLTGKGEVIAPVRDLAAFEWPRSRPARAFTWRPDQRHRPGLAFISATGRLHGFESLAERRVLLALDFEGGLTEVLSQPFTLRFTTRKRAVRHTPDFLVLTRGTALLIDVRPADLIKQEDSLKFAAAHRAAAAAGWQYIVVAGWQLRPWAAIEAFSARRRAMSDPLGLLPELLTLTAQQPRRLAELVAATSRPVLARAYVLHLLWSRRLTMDVALPLGDGSWIHRPRRG
ncbi:TnsA-like heteromeric transposase endonuclease subunit [Streptomyces rubiginosohelvolus]|uniref:TnsA-like heteromeric transposase endonuclease subunit n=1 Tax=Streptomyces rubiginosohelvolus TaxID=67362 RepID=UPI0036478169